MAKNKVKKSRAALNTTGAYARKKARRAASKAGKKSYTVGGVTRYIRSGGGMGQQKTGAVISRDGRPDTVFKRPKTVLDSGGARLDARTGQPFKKPVSVLSSDAGKNLFETENTKHLGELQRINTFGASTTPIDPTKPTTKKPSPAPNAFTFEEMRDLNLDLGNARYDTETNTFIPLENLGEAGEPSRTQLLREQLQNDEDEIDRTFKAQEKYLDNASNAQMRAIRDIYSARSREQREQNAREVQQAKTMGYRGGGAQYAPEVNAGIIGGTERAGLKRLDEIAALEANAIAEAEIARQEKKYSLFADKRNELKEIRKERQAELNKLLEAAQESRDEELERRGQAERDSAITSLITEGLSDPVSIFNRLRDSGIQGTTFDEVKAITDALKPKSAGGEYGTYLELKEAGEVGEETTFFDYLKQKKSAESGSTFGVAGSSGDVARDVESIMSGTGLRLSDLPTSDNYRAAVASELGRRKEEARKSGDIMGIIRASAGQGDPSEQFATSFEKAVNVIYQVNDLKTLFESDGDFVDQNGQKTNIDLAPIENIWRSRNPYDVKAQQIMAQLKAIVPNLARGIYGEVGVLTDADIKNYSQTLPRLSSPEKVRNAVLGLTIKTIQRSLENKIKINSNKDLTHIEGLYEDVQKVADELLSPKAESLEEFYIMNPDKESDVERMIEENPELSDEDLLEILNGNSVIDERGPTAIEIPPESRLSYVNNNPGNLRYAGQPNAEEGEGGFAKFKNPKLGYMALENQIKLDASRNLSLASFIKKYAPPTENDTSLYIDQISQMLGIPPSTKIKGLDVQELARAIAMKESGAIIG